MDGSLSVTLYVESLNPDKTSDVGRMKGGDIIELWGLEADNAFLSFEAMTPVRFP